MKNQVSNEALSLGSSFMNILISKGYKDPFLKSLSKVLNKKDLQITESMEIQYPEGSGLFLKHPGGHSTFIKPDGTIEEDPIAIPWLDFHFSKKYKDVGPVNVNTNEAFDLNFNDIPNPEDIIKILREMSD